MKMKVSSILMLIVTLASSSNASRMRSKMSSLAEGMDKQEVIHRLGKPDGFKKQGEYESLEYTHRLIAYGTLDRADYHVILKDSKVVEYGTGEVRMKDGNVMFLVPINIGR